MKYLFGIISVLVAVGAGFLFSQWLHQRSEDKATVSSQVLLEHVKDVSKFVTVEGYFSEIYNYKNYYNYDWSIFRKKALVRVRARVSMGIDMEQVKFEMNHERKILTIGPIPAPTIISLEHDTDYYDITEGTFNSFSTEDFNKINQDTKEYIRKRALESDLVPRANARTSETIQTIRILAETAGWKVEIDSMPALKN